MKAASETYMLNTWYPRIEVFIRNFSGLSVEDREDALQEIMLKLSRKRTNGTHSAESAAWVYAVARNHCIDVLRKRGRGLRVVPFDDENHYQGNQWVDPTKGATRRETRDEVQRFLETLSDEDRQLAYLRFFEEMKFRDIAEVLELPSGTLRYRVHHIKKSLARHVEEELEI